jgi:hypothetical protein
VQEAEAFPAVLTHAHAFDPFDVDRRKRMMEAYLAAVASVPVYEIWFSADPARFSVLLDSIEETLGRDLAHLHRELLPAG